MSGRHRPGNVARACPGNGDDRAAAYPGRSCARPCVCFRSPNHCSTTVQSDDTARIAIIKPKLSPDGIPLPDREGSVLSLSKTGFHRVAYVEWGSLKSDRVAICVHGLSRQGRDFDVLAAAMAKQGWRVICPDLVGRGKSDWLQDPEEYNLPQYSLDMTAIIARVGAAKVDWIGTSLGGLVGIVLAGQKDTPIQRLVLNDIGPFIPSSALHRLAANFRGAPRSYPTLEAATAQHRVAMESFGDLSDLQWQHLTRHSVEQVPDGTWHKRCDADITAAFRPGWYFNLSLWNYWDAIKCPVLALRGADSDLLSPSTTAEMSRRGPRSDTVEFPGCGHAPALMDPDQIKAITAWMTEKEFVAA